LTIQIQLARQMDIIDLTFVAHLVK
jgi:hypothetical protein